MTAQISAYGRLVADPQIRTTGKGTNMAMARLAVALPSDAADNGEATFWLGVIAFGKQADALAKHRKGDLALNTVLKPFSIEQCALFFTVKKHSPY